MWRQSAERNWSAASPGIRFAAATRLTDMESGWAGGGPAAGAVAPVVGLNRYAPRVTVGVAGVGVADALVSTLGDACVFPAGERASFANGGIPRFGRAVNVQVTTAPAPGGRALAMNRPLAVSAVVGRIPAGIARLPVTSCCPLVGSRDTTVIALA